MRFDSYHPGIEVAFFVLVIAGAVLFDHPVALAIGWVCSCAYSIKLNGHRAVMFNSALIPCALVFALFYSSFVHFGMTELGRNAIGNRYTLESFVYGCVVGVQVSIVLMWLSCLHAVFSRDKVVYLLGRVAPKASLMMAVAFRFAPLTKAHGRSVNRARSGIGRGVGQGSFIRRMANGMGVASTTLSWLMESVITASDSMKSRGVELKGRTAYALYRFDARDRAFVIGLFACACIVLAGVLLDQMSILYDPEIIMNRMTPLSWVVFAFYAGLCLMPLLVQVAGETRFAWAVSSMPRM